MKKSNKAASLSAFLFPGMGQFYLKKHTRGALFFIVAAIGFMMMMVAAFSIALSISEDIQLGRVTLNSLLNSNGIKELAQRIMNVFQEPQLIYAKTAMIASWIISTLDAWLSGRRIEKEEIEENKIKQI